MSLGISLRQIQTLSANRETYIQGIRYYQDGRVHGLQFQPGVPSFHAFVDGPFSYEVQIGITSHGRLGRVQCDCPAFTSYDGYCKHVVAVLYSLLEWEKEAVPHAAALETGHRRALRDLLDLFQQEPSKEASRSSAQPLSVEYWLGLVPCWDNQVDRWLTVRLKVGPKRHYVVKNIREFLQAFAEGESLFFTNHFTYDPTQFRPAAEDEAMLRFLSRLARNEQQYRHILSPWDSDRREDRRNLIIPPDQVGDCLRLLPRGHFVWEQGGRRYTELSLINRFPISFYLGKQGRDLVLLSEDEGAEDGPSLSEEPLLLSRDGTCFYKGNIYNLTSRQMEQILPLYRRLRQLPEKKLWIVPGEEQEAFVSIALPVMKEEGCLNVDRRVSTQLLQRPLQAEIRLDRRIDEEREQLTADLRYTYGEIQVNPFTSGEKQGRDGRLLIREMDKEQRIMQIFEEAGFQFNGRELHLDGEENLYSFLYDKMPQLEELADVYTTLSLRQILVEPASQPVPRIDVDDTSGWLEVQFDLPDVGEEELERLLQALIEKKRYYRLSEGSFIPLEGSESFHALMEEGGRPVIEEGKLKLPASRALQLEEMEGLEKGPQFQRLLRNIRNPENLDFTPPAAMASVLRDYQRFGFRWMKTLAHYQLGGILADDMGLGKTIQALAFIVSELEAAPTKAQALVVAPASLIYNWERECTRFAPQLKTVVVAGKRERRRTILEHKEDVDLLITSYPLLRRDIDSYQSHRFQTVIFDEAQSFKNHQSQTAQVVKRLRAKTRFALSGTPIENTLEELGSIFDVILPGFFSGKQAVRRMSAEQVRRRVRPFILRRMKRDVLDELPEKTVSVHVSELTDEQKELYLATLQQIRKNTQQALITDGFQKSRIKILAGLTRLRQICCHPSLYLENYAGSSGKMDQLLATVEERLNNRRRLLVFSQFTSMLALIRDALDRRGISYHYLDGRTPSPQRLEMANRFSGGEKDVFLISLKAGGTGLNLTGADTVILYDLWWNPAVEQQAADRAHRIGQKKTVEVLKLIARGTIEEKIHELQQKKQSLFDQVIQPGEAMLSSWSEEEIREILGLM